MDLRIDLNTLLKAEIDYMPICGYSNDALAMQKRNEALSIMDKISHTKFIILYFVKEACDRLARKFSIEQYLWENNDGEDYDELAKAQKMWESKISCEFKKIINHPGLRHNIAPVPRYFMQHLIPLLNLDATTNLAIRDYAIYHIYRRIIPDIRFTRFKPSILAASAVLLSVAERRPDAYPNCQQIIRARLGKTSEVDIMKCMKEMVVRMTVGLIDVIWPTESLPEEQHIKVITKVTSSICALSIMKLHETPSTSVSGSKWKRNGPE